MTGHPARQRPAPTCVAVLLAVCTLLLAGCLPANRSTPRQTIIEWPEKRLIFMADERVGSVRAFHSGTGTPILAAQTRTFERSSVRDIQLDKTRGQLWVLGPDAAYVHDAGTLALLKRIPLESRDVAEMRIEEDGVTLLASDSVVLGRIDMKTRLAAWRPALSVRRS